MIHVFIIREFWQTSDWFTCLVCLWLIFCLKSSIFKNNYGRGWISRSYHLNPVCLQHSSASASITDVESFYCSSALKNAAFGALVSSQRNSLKISQEQTAFGNKAPLKIHFQMLFFWITWSLHNFAINASDKILLFIQGIQKQKLKQGLFRQLMDQTLEAQCLSKLKYSILSSQTKIY